MKTFAKKIKRPTPSAHRSRTAVPSFFTPAAQVQRAQVRQVLRTPQIQAKLTISQPDDKYEQEADRVADEVMRMPEPVVQRQSEDEERKQEEIIQRKTLADKITPLIQRRIAATKEKKRQIQTKSNRQPQQVTPHFESGLNTLGTGQPLPKETRAFFEPRFGRDFSSVKVHTDSRADQLVRSINARAFTRGNDIVFGTGEYRPGSLEGKMLLGHELAHVVQQNQIISSVLQRKHIDIFTEKINEDLPQNQLIQKIRELHREILRQRELSCQCHNYYVLDYNLKTLKWNYNKLRKQLLRYEARHPLCIVLVDNKHTFFHGGVRARAISILKKHGILHPQAPKIRRTEKLLEKIQRNYFVNVASSVARHNRCRLFKVKSHQEALSRLQQIVNIHNNNQQNITTLALVGHGSARHGWIRMGDIGSMLLDKTVQQGLSPNLRIILYMCSAGGDPTRRNDKGYMPGGLHSYASILRARLVQAGIFNAKVWAHVTSGDAGKNPQWRIFETEEIQDRRRVKPETSYFRRIFDDNLVNRNFRELQCAQRRYSQTLSHLPRNADELRVKWMWYFYYNITQQQRGVIAEQIPFEPNRYHDVILGKWNKYFYLGDLNVIKPVAKGHHNFLKTRNFKMLMMNLMFCKLP